MKKKCRYIKKAQRGPPSLENENRLKKPDRITKPMRLRAIGGNVNSAEMKQTKITPTGSQEKAVWGNRIGKNEGLSVKWSSPLYEETRLHKETTGNVRRPWKGPR